MILAEDKVTHYRPTCTIHAKPILDRKRRNMLEGVKSTLKSFYIQCTAQ